jgi:polyisoprenoid-binding protein YceI
MANDVKWVLDPSHSELIFKVKHLMISNVKGEFRKFNATVEGEDFSTAKLSAEVETNSIFTNDDNRDNHLRSGDFFDTENFPTMNFVGKRFKQVDGDEWELTGDLRIRDTTKEVTLKVEFGGINKDPWGNEKAGFSISGKINRKDWGLNWNAALETGGVLVSEDVRISGELQFVKQA